ncbi:MAG: TCP-1/cpn60 chaperonin family protein [Candidatus Heimdallarchaeota archaeon]|nr:TCP-1/cpn60 chaperonin family protein [Candidatus Heimdallarchaeota archaeon]MCK5049103.1 TCP-1/cpn60 chaperonin family protein [Candidatus Heimdallarchaeota archaeon]
MSGQIPVILLKEGSERSTGQEAMRNNILAASAIADAVKSTLGPKGMDKMLVDSLGDIVITNDGATILDELDVEHPAAKMIIQVAKNQDDEVGDGTTSAVIIAGELLAKGKDLLEKKIHATSIVAGYKQASDDAKVILESLAIQMDEDDKDVLRKIALTALNSKAVSNAREHIADIAVEAVSSIVEVGDNNTKTADLDLVKIIQRQGKSLSDTLLIHGVVIDKEILHPDMPKEFTNAKILLLNKNIEIEKTEFDSEIRISSPDQVQQFLDNEERLIKEMVDKISNSGANVVICQKGIDDLAQYFLAQKGILAVRRVKKSDIEKISKSTGATIITSLDDIPSEGEMNEVLGHAGKVHEEKIGDEEHIFITECKKSHSVSILIRGVSKYSTDETERALVDALSVVRDVIEDGTYVSGGGSTEIELSLKLREKAANIKGKEQLAYQAFAEALEIIPNTLSENAGYDPIAKINEIISAHSGENKHSGINVHDGTISNMIELGILEPLRVKIQAIKSASEAAEMILRIDDVIAIKGSPEGAGMPPGGMPPMM